MVAPQALMLSWNQLERMLAFTDVFLPNDDEAYAMTGLKDPADEANFFSRLNPDCAVVVIMGQRGALACRRGEMIQVGRYQVKAGGESGVGDAFSTGFITGPQFLELRFSSFKPAKGTAPLGYVSALHPKG